MNANDDFEILTTSRLWVATPWNYSSSRWLRFKSNENSDCCYGYGQTIYAVINFDFKIVEENTLQIAYLNSPAVGHRFNGFSPNQNTSREIQYELIEKITTGSKSITNREFKYHWVLKLSASPFPEEIQFPYEIPLEYYGHSEYSNRKSGEN